VAERHFTVTEANALLERVRPLVEQMVEYRRELGDALEKRGRLGEDEIAWWHTLGGGFAGRRPL
jgi:hypothetical protein